MTINEKLTVAIDRYDKAIHEFPEGDLERETAAINLIKAMSEAKIAETTLIEKMYADLITAAGNVNRHVEDGDMNRNRVNYGIATKCADVLRLLGHEATCDAWEDNGFMRIPKVTVNGKTMEYHNGK